MDTSENRINIAVLVSGGGTNLQALIDAEKAGRVKSGRLALVISSKPDAYALVRAQEAGIPTEVVSKKQYGSEGMEKHIRRLLEMYGIKLIVLAGFMSILSREFTTAYDHRIINVHPSLIPSFCGEGFYGLHVHEAALAKGVRITGATVHFVNEIPDGGDIIEQKAVRVFDGDTPERLQKRVMRQAEWKILPAATETVARKILKGEI
ncbi:MAG: phosphoribosylglycinamide formyltransferase [Ruminococcus sp.]|jgi:phosphoribosylglycinamide formyltransferase|nr:phosphoribosylglycinamide formyltransferase [Ruminococcus sp.]MDD7670176.1 phosphoribosylglycinamide formyltransferase [Ruminococcus sp.]CDD02080.1 phosphoribosylglycinamide formyltransferase [Ruminococcus sp. CAG:382]